MNGFIIANEIILNNDTFETDLKSNINSTPITSTANQIKKYNRLLKNNINNDAHN